MGVTEMPLAEYLGRAAGLAAYPSEAVGWAPWLPGFWSSFLDGQDWALYAVIDGLLSASLPRQGSTEVCRVRSWVLKSGQNMHQILWSAKAVGLALHMGNTMDCALFPSDIDIGRLAFASSFVLWLKSRVRQAEACIL